MTSICPTITADNAHTYRSQIERVAPFVTRLHIDIADGTLAPSNLLELDKIWWPGGVRADLHVMTKRPFDHLELFRALAPQLVIVHAEAQGGFVEFATLMHHHGIETGVALLQDTPVDMIVPAISLIDHVLVFSGNFGQFGGKADPSLLGKVRQLRQIKPTLEIGWDGGVNDQNAQALKHAGVDVLNVGGFIHRSQNPRAAYDRLVQL